MVDEEMPFIIILLTKGLNIIDLAVICWDSTKIRTMSSEVTYLNLYN